MDLSRDLQGSRGKYSDDFSDASEDEDVMNARDDPAERVENTELPLIALPTLGMRRESDEYFMVKKNRDSRRSSSSSSLKIVPSPSGERRPKDERSNQWQVMLLVFISICLICLMSN